MMEVAQHMRELDALMGSLQGAGTEGEEGELAEQALALAAERLRCVFEEVFCAMNLRSRPFAADRIFGAYFEKILHSLCSEL